MTTATAPPPKKVAAVLVIGHGLPAHLRWLRYV
jgi:hypothetical protein